MGSCWNDEKLTAFDHLQPWLAMRLNTNNSNVLPQGPIDCAMGDWIARTAGRRINFSNIHSNVRKGGAKARPVLLDCGSVDNCCLSGNLLKLNLIDAN